MPCNGRLTGSKGAEDAAIYIREAFKENGFAVIHAHELIEQLESGKTDVAKIKDTVILMPSAELSRARGGFHCMSMPLLRDEI